MGVSPARVAPARRRARDLSRPAVVAYAAAVVAAEACIAFGGVVSGAIAHAVLALMLLAHATVERARSGYVHGGAPRRSSSPSAAFVALALVPLLRILSLTMVPGGTPKVYQYALVGIPLLVATFSAAQAAGVDLIGRVRARWASREQGVIAAAGVPLGLAAYALAQPAPLVDSGAYADLALAVALVAVFVGVTEELVFRGVVQDALTRLFPRTGYLAGSAVFAATYLAAGSADYVVLMALVGLAFAWLVRRTGSLAGVATAHALLAVGALLIWPAILG